MFYDRKLSNKYIKRLKNISGQQIKTDDSAVLARLAEEDRLTMNSITEVIERLLLLMVRLVTQAA